MYWTNLSSLMACVSRYFSAQNHLFAMADVENLYRNQILPQLLS